LESTKNNHRCRLCKEELYIRPVKKRGGGVILEKML
jgi:hypothetical protein